MLGLGLVDMYVMDKVFWHKSFGTDIFFIYFLNLQNPLMKLMFPSSFPDLQSKKSVQYIFCKSNVLVIEF